MNGRGVAQSGATENAEDTAIVERGMLREFIASIKKLNGVSIKLNKQESPPLPDFSCFLNEKNITVELTEFMDEKIIKEAKYIQATPEDPLCNQGLWFDTSEEWFHSILLKTINKKEKIYNRKQIYVDVLLVWNELVQLSLENTNSWLGNFKVPELDNIGAIYFQSWYHPKYLARPTWSLIEHPDIGSVAPVLEPNAL
ncbi:MAG: hypothetical protein COA69_04530 [Robiginitomaculum sp.]|nr:MAG: hypothetical protein COA69_04530 [Robiginitomaculum sp.]